MKCAKYLRLAGGVCVLLTAAALTGCGGGGSSNLPPPAKPEILYGTGFNQILGLKVNSTTGAVSPATITPGPNTSLGTTQMIATDPGKFLFVYDTEGQAIDVFAINLDTTALTAVGSPVSTGAIGPAGGLALDPSGKFLYVAGAAAIEVFSINSTSGALTPAGSPSIDNNGPYGLLATGKFLYASEIGNGSTATISGFSVNPSTGSLTPVPASPVSTAVNGFPFFLAAHPSGKFLYAGFLTANTLAAWTIDGATGALTPTPGFPIALGIGTGSFISSVVVAPQGKFLYVCDDLGDVFGFAVNSSSGALTAMPGSPFPFLFTAQLFADPSGKFLYSPTGPFLAGFTVDATTGIPTPMGLLPFALGQPLTVPATLAFVKATP